jgi:hypothetical protein
LCVYARARPYYAAYASRAQKDIKEKWKAEAKKERDAYKAKTARQKYAKNDAYKTFRERIYVRAALPPML